MDNCRSYIRASTAGDDSADCRRTQLFPSSTLHAFNGCGVMSV